MLVVKPSPWQELESAAVSQALERNAVIYGEDRAFDRWYRVEAGVVRTTWMLSDGHRHIAAFYFPGDYFGLDRPNPRPLAAEAVTDATISVFSRQVVEQILGQNPSIAEHIIALLQQELSRSRSRQLLLSRATPTQRVTAFLVDMAQRGYPRRMIDIPMSRLDIADYLGLRLETISRVLSQLKRDGLIDMPTSQTISVQDAAALAALSER